MAIETKTETEKPAAKPGRPPKARYALYHRPQAAVQPVKCVVAGKNEDGTYNLNFADKDGKDTGTIFVKGCPTEPVKGGGHCTIGTEAPEAPGAETRLTDESVTGEPVETELK